MLYQYPTPPGEKCGLERDNTEAMAAECQVALIANVGLLLFFLKPVRLMFIVHRFSLIIPVSINDATQRGRTHALQIDFLRRLPSIHGRGECGGG